MLLRIAYKTLVDLGTVAFIISGILIVIAAVVNSNELMRSIGFPTWKEWWDEIRKH